MNELNLKYLLLGSGGLDSTVTGHGLKRRGELAGVLFITYGQPAEAYERSASKAWASRWYVPWFEVELNLQGLASMRAPKGEEGPRVVPGRNLAFIAAAANVAIANGMNGVAIGCSGADHADYADCRPMFLHAASAVFQQLDLWLSTPVAFQTRKQIRDYAVANGISLEDVWSCYTPDMGKPCGRCNSCLQDA